MTDLTPLEPVAVQGLISFKRKYHKSTAHWFSSLLKLSSRATRYSPGPSRGTLRSVIVDARSVPPLFSTAGACDCTARCTPNDHFGQWIGIRRPANPSCESFIKTLKREEIYANKYDNLDQLRANIEEFIDEYYNRQRLHSALGYRSPEEFERTVESQAESRSATMTAFGNKESGEKISTGLLGEGTQTPSLSPDPFSC